MGGSGSGTAGVRVARGGVWAGPFGSEARNVGSVEIMGGVVSPVQRLVGSAVWSVLC